MLIIKKVFHIYNANGGQIDLNTVFISEEAAQAGCDLLNSQDYGIPGYTPEWTVLYIDNIQAR